MNFKSFVVFIAVLNLSRLCTAGESPEQFVKTVFGELPAVQNIRLTGDVKAGVKEVYGDFYSGSSVSYWPQDDRRIWALKARGKHGFIHAGLVIREGRVVRVKVLSSKEQRGRMIETPRFLDQFIGAGLKNSKELDQRIDGISGATYSVNAMRKMAQCALFLDSIVSEKQGEDRERISLEKEE